MKETNSKVYFDKVAPKWDRMRHSFFPDALRDKALSVANVQPGKLAADLGAGTGFVTEGLLAKGLRVIAVDQSEEMLSQMRQKFANFSDVDYRIGESENLPILDGSVEYVFANMYLHHVENPHLAIPEMARVLKPGGKVVITDLDEHNHEYLRIEQYDRWLGFKRHDIHKWLSKAGLSGISVHSAGECCCTESADLGETAEVSIFIGFGEK